MTETPPTLIFLSGDLIFAGRVRAICEQAGGRLIFAVQLPEMNAAEAEAVRLVVLDLGTRNGLASHLVAEAKRRYPGAEVIAYASHVHKQRLAEARQAGFDRVLTRGQFDAGLPELGSQLAETS